VLLILLVVGGLAWLGMVALAWMATGPPVHVADGDWLELDLAGPLPDASPERVGLGALAPMVPSAVDVQVALRRARDDARIAGVLVRPDGFQGGWAQAAEIRRALVELRERGKQVVAYLEAPGSAAYHVASAANNIAIAPEGSLFALGISARLTYLRGTLDKLGMEADYIVVGEYKSAPEQFQRREPSAPSRRQTEAYVDTIYRGWIEDLAQGRGVTSDRMMSLVDRAPHDAAEALAAGLVDTVLDPLALEDVLGGGRVGLLDYLQATSAAGEVRVALVHVAGTILSGPSGSGGFGGPVAGSDTVLDRLRRAGEDDGVEAVVLRVDSPGGSAIASDVIYREVLRLRERKPVVVSMGNLAASGGYYVAMAADHLVADPFTLTGSIGVYAGKFDQAGLYEKLGLGFDVVQRGENASLFSDLQGFTPGQRRRLTQHLAPVYDRFVERVAEHRGLESAAAEAAAQGRVWSGEDALGTGLVDTLGGLPQAGAVALELAGHDPSAGVHWVSYQRQPGFLERLLGSLVTEPEVSAVPPLPGLAEVAAAVEPWWRTLDGSPQFHVLFALRGRGAGPGGGRD